MRSVLYIVRMYGNPLVNVVSISVKHTCFTNVICEIFILCACVCVCVYISRIQVTCWLRQHYSSLSRISQNCVVSRGRLGSQPLLSHRVTLEPSPWRPARVLHHCSLAHTGETQYFCARIFYIDIPFSLPFFPF